MEPFTQDICSSNGDNTIHSVVCSFLLLLVIIYPWLSTFLMLVIIEILFHGYQTFSYFKSLLYFHDYQTFSTEI